MFDLNMLSDGKPYMLTFKSRISFAESIASSVDVMDYYISYVLWLMELTNTPLSYSQLFNELLQVEFTWFRDTSELSMDENRHKDALRLRNEFFDEFVADPNRAMDLDELLGGLRSSVLEVIIALCRRMEHHVSERTTEEIFWDILENLKLDDMNNSLLHYDVEEGPQGRPYFQMSQAMEEMYERIDILVNRKYRKDGKGSMFPIKKKGYNINEMELWRQANLYCQFKKG